MKKHITKLIVLLTCLGMFASCNKALEMAPDGRLSLDDVFADSEQVAAFLNSCYSNIPGKGFGYYFFSRGPVVWSDEAWDTDAESAASFMAGRLYNGNASAANHPIVNVSDSRGNGNYWDRYWAAIRNCSEFIQRIDDAVVSNPADRQRWKAEAHLLRAYYYHELLKWYGAVLPIMREPYAFDGDFSLIEKATYKELVDFIVEDCDVALSTPELPWRITMAAEAHRITKAAGEAIKSKVILFAASPQNNDGQDLWTEAYEINKQSLENLRQNGYVLYDKVNFPQTYLSDLSHIGPVKDENASRYNEYFTREMQFSQTPVDRETIYQSYLSHDQTAHLDGVGAQNGYKSGTCPSQELVDAYETIDGQPVLNLERPYLDEKHLEPNYNTENSLYNPADPYANRDPRFYASIYYNGSKRYAFWNFAEAPGSVENFPAPIGARTRVIATWMGEPQTGINPTKRSATRTGYYQRKFLHPTAGTNQIVWGTRTKLFRLGEVILNFAEAAAEAGHLDEARTAVNEIRKRVGMPSLPTGLSKEELILRVRNERRVELALEENRYFDVRRWTKPNEDLEKTDRWITAMEISRGQDGTFTYKRRLVREGGRQNYTNRFLWLPIPLNEANRLRAITGDNWQNPGW
ncbi:RagB/SusD family nutrient uptake outer membrane protein [Sphingobacterium pedocola]|nr:RagB/SusD family nutrient uptake outer membrane protein [Sphingobacterium pedocola]